MNSSGQIVAGNVTSFPAVSPVPQDYLDTIRIAKVYSLAFIIPVGLLTNVLSLGVMFLSPLGGHTTGHYLIALAFADITILLGELLSWLNSFTSDGPVLGLDFSHTIRAWCIITNYLRYAGRLWSSWLTVVITIERFLTVAFPLRVGRISTARKAKVGIAIIAVFAFGSSSFVFWTLDTFDFHSKLRCQVIRETQEIYKICNWIILKAGELIIPSILVSVFTTLIIVNVSHARKERRSLSYPIVASNQRPRRSSNEAQITTMLLSVAVTFIVLRTPYSIMYYINSSKSRSMDPWLSFYIQTGYYATYVLAVTNYAVNFFLFCLTGSNFRRHFLKVYCCRDDRRLGRRSTATGTMYMQGPGSAGSGQYSMKRLRRRASEQIKESEEKLTNNLSNLNADQEYNRQHLRFYNTLNGTSPVIQ